MSAGIRESRGTGASILVAAISTAFGVVLLSATGYLAAVLRADPYLGESDTLALVLGILSALLLGVALYVAAIVTANTFATVVAGRTRRIALLRLIGASARSQRSEIGRQGLSAGLWGALIGLAAGIGIAALGIIAAEAILGVPSVDYPVVQPVLALPAIAVTLTTWAAAWAGSRRVLTVTPLQALGGAVEQPYREARGSRARTVGALVLLGCGVVLLAGGILVGFVTPFGVVVAFFGGGLSFSGLAGASTLFMPPLLRAVGRLFGRSAMARLAAENALRHPERSSRMTIGVVMGVALVTMFGVAGETTKSVIAASGEGEAPAELTTLLDTFSGIMMGLVAVAAVIAAVGLVNLLTLGILQRRRELGLLRALGVTDRQVRRLVLLEAAHVTVTATVTGLVLGILYGWVAAQSLFGAIPMPPAWSTPTFVLPAVPWGPVAVIVVATAVLTLLAAVAPTRLATNVTPVEALREDGGAPASREKQRPRGIRRYRRRGARTALSPAGR